MMMSIELGGRFADEELRSLHAWLQRDSDVRRSAQMHLDSKGPADGQMGDALDLISLVTAGGLALPGFVQTLLTWRDTRRQQCTITLTIDGTSAIIEGVDQRTATEIVAQLLRKDEE